jgi:hydroxypyruvate reductase
MTPDDRARLLQQIWWAGVEAVRGDTAVAHALDHDPIPRPDLILAVGKAAVAMAKPAFARFGPVRTLAITKQDHGEPGLGFEVLEASHPVPDASSLAAGARLLAEVQAAPPGSHLLLLVSGGASALVEAPRPGVGLDDIMGLNRALLASGKDIAAMNAERTKLSQIKGGGLLGHFRGARVTVLAVSDTRGDLIETIGSGIGLCHPRDGLAQECRIVASNTVARAAAAVKAEALGLTVRLNAETLYDDVAASADLMASELGGPGLYVWGGEPTVILPPNPGLGGRNQALALRMAQVIQGAPDVSVLVAGTDGSDGPTTAAGGLVDGTTWTEAAPAALSAADSGTFLDQRGALFVTGPTGTNVMDLALALRA